MSFICVSKRNNIWYKFHNHRWQLTNSRKTGKYEYDCTFINKLDKNNNLVAFENGVYDLANNHFRQGLPSDNISKTIGYNYENYQCQDENFFGKEHLNLLSQICCSPHDSIAIFKDLYKNQKDFLSKTLKLVLGDYCQIIQADADDIDKNVKIYILDNFELSDAEIDEYMLRIYESNTFGIPIIMCDKPPITNFKEDWFWRRILVVPNTDNSDIKMFSSTYGKIIINQFLKQNQKFSVPFEIKYETVNYRTYCESYDTIKMNDCIVRIPKIIKETNIYSLFSDGELTNVILHNADLRGINMYGIRINNCDFSGSNFRGSKFDNAIIKNTKMHDVDFRLVTMDSGKMKNVDFSGTQFNDVIFTHGTIYKSIFTDTNFHQIQNFHMTYKKCIGI